MPLPELIAALERDVRAEAEASVEEARRSAELCRREGRIARAGRKQAELDALRRELDEAERGGLSEARREARRRVLETRARTIEEVLGQARELVLQGALAERMREAVPRLLRAAFERVGDGACRVRCSPELAEATREALGARTEVSVEPDEAVVAGVIVEAQEGRLVVDATPAALLEARRAHLAVAIGERLRVEFGVDVSALGTIALGASVVDEEV